MATAETVPEIRHLDRTRLRKHGSTLTKCQKAFVTLVLRWFSEPRKLLVVVSGGPGTGKSYVVKNTLDCIDLPQLRMSFTARSARAIGGVTIHSAVNLNWRPGSLYERLEKELKDIDDLSQCIELSRDIMTQFSCRERPCIVAVDEVSMINGWLMYWLIRYFMDRADCPLLFVCMGDPHQLNPVRSIHNLFSITFTEKLYRVRKIHLMESKRFTPDYEILINGLRECVDRGDETGLFSFICHYFPVVDSIDHTLLRRANRAMAFRNDRVKRYNAFYIQEMLPGPEIHLGNDLIVKRNCMVFVTKNGYSEKAENGTQLIFKAYLESKNTVVCEDPLSGEGILIWRDDMGSFPLDLGFAGTVHKFQGNTIDDAKLVICFCGNRNLNLAYTALSRVRQKDQILAVEL